MEENETQGRAVDLGYVIGQKREQSGLSVAEVASATRMRPAHISAIEAGALEKLPGEPYTRAYIRRYAEFLDLDTDNILETYDGAGVPSAGRLKKLPEIFSSETHASGALALASTLLVIVFVTLWNIVNPVATASLVLPFTELDVVSVGVLPHRCGASQAVYPPCSWELTELWYDPVKPKTHIFAVQHEPTP